MKRYLTKITLALLLVLTVTSCSQRNTVVVKHDKCTEASVQKKINTVIDIPSQKNIPFKRIGKTTVVNDAIEYEDAKYLSSIARTEIVVSTDSVFNDMLMSISKYKSAVAALTVIRDFYENQVDRNNNRLKDINVSKQQ